MHFDVQFAKKLNYKGDSVYLRANIYEPNASGKKPLLLFLHGGGFVIGDKRAAVASSLCFALAQQNIVSVSINYRLGFGKGEDRKSEGVITVLRAMEDLHDAIAFFKQDSIVEAYQIDTNRIYIGGSSAGGITALHYAFMDGQEFKEYYGDITNSTSDFASDFLEKKYQVKGVLSFCGGISQVAFCDDEIPLAMAHGDQDDFVPFVKGLPHPPRFLPGFSRIPKQYMFGSGAIYDYMGGHKDSVYLEVFRDKGHIPYEPPLHRKTYMDYLDRIIHISNVFINGGDYKEQKSYLDRVTVIEQANRFVIYLPDRTQSDLNIKFIGKQGQSLKQYKLKRNHPFFILEKTSEIPYEKLLINTSKYKNITLLVKDVLKI